MRDRHLAFVIKSIQALQTALFTDLSEGELKFFSSVIKLSSADEENGKLFFFPKKPCLDMSGFAANFRAQLQFFRKQMPFYITVEGTARLNAYQFASHFIPEEKVLIEFTICHATYVATKPTKDTFPGLLWQAVSWLIPEIVNSRSELHFY
jgi:hypothetical protein